MSRYINIGGQIFNTAKVLSAHSRNSFMFIKYPFILELKYSKKWTETFYLGLGEGKVLIPLDTHHNSMDLKFKFETLCKLKATVAEIEAQCPNAVVSSNFWKD